MLRGVDLDVPPGRIVAVLGPNRAGRSTLMQLLSGCLRPSAGHIALDGRRLQRMATGGLARRRAILPQSPWTGPGFTAAELVALGRHPHRGRNRSGRDAAVIEAAMTAPFSASPTLRGRTFELSALFRF